MTASILGAVTDLSSPQKYITWNFCAPLCNETSIYQNVCVITQSFLPLSTKIVAHDTHIEVNCTYYVSEIRPSIGEPSKIIVQLWK